MSNAIRAACCAGVLDYAKRINWESNGPYRAEVAQAPLSQSFGLG
jgi:hypothetical protein